MSEIKRRFLNKQDLQIITEKYNVSEELCEFLANLVYNIITKEVEPFELLPSHGRIPIIFMTTNFGLGYNPIACRILQKYNEVNEHLKQENSFWAYSFFMLTNEQLKELIKDNKIIGNVNEQDSYGRTPLMYRVDDSEDIDLLLKCGADINIRDNFGNTVIFDPFVDLEMLISKGANVNIRNNRGENAIEYITRKYTTTRLINPETPGIIEMSKIILRKYIKE